MRLFFALWPPLPAAAKLVRIARSAAENHGGRPTRRDTLHITLIFLGEIPANDVPKLITTAKGIRAAPFGLEIDRLGYWQYKRLLWAGCHTPPAGLPSPSACATRCATPDSPPTQEPLSSRTSR